MESLAQSIDEAVQQSNYDRLAAIFSFGPESWQSVGQGEQRSLAAHFIKTAIASPSFLPKAFHSSQMMHVMLETLGHLPSTVEGAADNQLRQRIFEHKGNEDADYSAAARVLSGMRMEDDPSSVYYMTADAKCDGESSCFYLHTEKEDSLLWVLRMSLSCKRFFVFCLPPGLFIR